MARKRKGRLINGILLVDKPQEVSSNHVVQRVKRIYKAAKAGHTGALDPLATGLLPVCLGEATKFSQFLLNADKSYFVTAKLGQRTDTSDADGEIVETRPVNVLEADIKEAIQHFVGPIKQIPSMFSALKHEGKPLYFYARQGITIERPARDITIYSIEWVSLIGDELSLNVTSSKGTYIRTLVDDLGQMLGCGAHVIVLRRTAVAHYKASQMISFDALDKLVESNTLQEQASQGALESVSEAVAQDFTDLDDLLLPMDTPIETLFKVEIGDQDTLYFQQGRDIKVDVELPEIMDSDQVVRVYQTGSMLFLGVASIDSTKTIHPKRVVVY
ncbi:MAG: tRNA pseudouridine55 synthase [Alphaproteobacteria bacterium]|jgi:tRNA pseudouridine55 synthase